MFTWCYKIAETLKLKDGGMPWYHPLGETLIIYCRLGLNIFWIGRGAYLYICDREEFFVSFEEWIL